MEVWIWFKRLSNRRQSGMGVNPITFTEIQSFFSLLGITPVPEEIELLELFDGLTVQFYNKQQAQAAKKSQSKPKG